MAGLAVANFLRTKTQNSFKQEIQHKYFCFNGLEAEISEQNFAIVMGGGWFGDVKFVSNIFDISLTLWKVSKDSDMVMHFLPFKWLKLC